MRSRLERSEGRRVFGTDPEAYDAARPGHPDEVYAILQERCGLRPKSKVLEVGPGTGQATLQLLALGASPLVAIEPDPGLAAFLQARLGERVEIRETTLEDAVLEGDFDLAVAASSFHWVEEGPSLAKLNAALRPGGCVALWWTVFGDATREDPFRAATDPLMRELPRSPSEADRGRPPFASDGGARVAALEAAGFEEATAHRLEWTHTWDTEGIRGLFATFSPVLTLEPRRREELLDAVARIADADFGGQVTKPLVTAVYAARKPS
jgi:SAM-dependent methyltransferase